MKKLFQKRVFIPFHLCDAAGVIFFGSVYGLAHEIYEQFVMEWLGMDWKGWFQNSEWIVPIKHSEADYYAPLCGGQWVDVEMELTRVGKTSLAFTFRFLRDGAECCAVKTVHVFCDRATKAKRGIPEVVLAKLK